MDGNQGIAHADLAALMKANAEAPLKHTEQLERIAYSTEYTRALTIGVLQTVKMLTLGPEKVFEFWYKGMKKVRFWLPKANMDLIQGHILLGEMFWDIRVLDQFKSFAKGKHVLDIGANIGNHTVYWGVVAGAASIEAFEPVPELFEVLSRNIEINKLDNAKAHQLALGAATGMGVLTSDPKNRMQSQVDLSDDGEIRIAALDDMGVTQVDFCKIDVEGHTLPLLQGARRTLAEFKPAIYIELFDHERDACMLILEDLGYVKAAEVEKYNFLFVHQHRKFEGELPVV